MFSDEIAIRAVNLGKSYPVYPAPRDRLKQFVLPRLQRATGRVPRQYYRDFRALSGVSFEVRKGESVGIIGRNGSGKSTLLQIIAGTLFPTSGSVETEGRIAALLELGSGFNPEFTGTENVFLNGTLLGLTTAEIEQRFDDIAGFADIGDHLDQPVKTYSSGMLVRLAFAIQVQVEPDILIVDEALAVGDALFQKRCFQRIERLLSDGTTLLFVSHDQESVRTLTSRALLLSKGESVAWGPSAEVVLQYRRLLHDDEATYLGKVARDIAARSQAAPAKSGSAESKAPSGQAPSGMPLGQGEILQSMSARLSFGDGEVIVTRVETLDGSGKPCIVFYPGDPLRIVVTCEARADIDHLNIAIRLRNKEGVKIYSWGTLNQDMALRATGSPGPVFWERSVATGEQFKVRFDCRCDLGINLYEIQAAVSLENSPDYLGQRILHWVDEAAFFQVAMKRDEHFFGGVVDLGMTATW